ncbi:hypothetical protein OS493_020517 [Desmophyllum pertusum]|uniref:Major facilitator superfamily associated domain-containing protein n=1 Tax=Desmophyllum pertusum TaxID=174260 RepID=A0A9W9YYS0_9CNID|nr:hypothetical protein OS493_020517 [Desmophyllum pertusum]
MTSDRLRETQKSSFEQEKSNVGRNIFNRFSRLAEFCGVEQIPYKLLFVSSYGAFGALLPYLPLYFKQIGLSAMETGVLIGLRPLLQAIGAPMFGFLADKYKRRRLILFMGAVAWIVKALLILAVRPRNQECVAIDAGNVNSTLSTISELGTIAKIILTNTKSNFSASSRRTIIQQRDTLPRQSKADIRSQRTEQTHDEAAAEKTPVHLTPRNAHRTQNASGHNATVEYEIKIDQREMSTIFGILLAVIIVSDLFGSVVHPISDGCVLDYLGDDRNMYGRVRLFGSAGIAFASFVVGLIINESIGYFCGQILKNYAIAFYFAVGLTVITLLALLCIKIVYRTADSAGHQTSNQELKTLFASLPKMAFWFVSVCLGTLDGFQMDFTSWFLDDLGASSFVIGLATGLHFLCNMLTFLVANYALEMLGYVRLISLSLVMYAVIFVCFSFAHSPWLGMVLYILLGTCFALSWTACVAYVASIASAVGLGATAQGILSGLYVGLGYGGGTMLGGLLISFTSIRTTWQLYSALAIVSLILYNVVLRLGNNTGDANEPEIMYKAVPFTEEDKEKN